MNIQTIMKKMETAIVMVTTIAQHQEAAVPTALVIHRVPIVRRILTIHRILMVHRIPMTHRVLMVHRGLTVHRIPTLEVQEVQVDFPAEVMEEHLAKRLKSAEAF